MIKLLNLGARSKYVLSFDPEKSVAAPTEEDPQATVEGPSATRWELAVLSTRVMGHLADKATKFSQTGTGMQADFQPNLVAYERVRLGLKGVENLTDDAGNAIELKLVQEVVPGLGKQEVVAVEFMDRLPREAIMELAGELMRINKAGNTLLGN